MGWHDDVVGEQATIGFGIGPISGDYDSRQNTLSIKIQTKTGTKEEVVLSLSEMLALQRSLKSILNGAMQNL